MRRIKKGALAAALILIGCVGATPALARGQHIVIFGATGAIGGVIAQEALSRGDFVTGVAREIGKSRIDDPHYKVVVGDVTDLASFRQVTQGADAVVITVLANGKGNAPEDSASARAAKVAVAAYSGLAHAPHVIQIGGAPTMYETREALLAHLPGMGLPAAPGSPMYGTIFGHLLALQTYRASHIRWTVITPPLQIQGWSPNAPPKPQRTGHYRISTRELVRDPQGHNAINIADLAVAVVDEVEHPHYIRQRFTVGY